jgi:hypothetical protein
MGGLWAIIRTVLGVLWLAHFNHLFMVLALLLELELECLFNHHLHQRDNTCSYGTLCGTRSH